MANQSTQRFHNRFEVAIENGIIPKSPEEFQEFPKRLYKGAFGEPGCEAVTVYTVEQEKEFAEQGFAMHKPPVIAAENKPAAPKPGPAAAPAPVVAKVVNKSIPTI